MSIADARRKLARLRRLSGAERRLLLRASVWLLAVDVGLRTVGFRRVRRLLDRPRRPDSPERPVGPDERREAEAVARVVAVAAHHHLYPMRCLRRALVLDRFLAERGIPRALRIGVRKEDGEMRAHAWVEAGGQPLSEPEDVEVRYATLDLPADLSDRSRRSPPAPPPARSRRSPPAPPAGG